MRRRVAKNILWMVSERGLQVAAGIGVVAMLARALGPDGFAQFQYAQAMVTIAASVALACGSEVVVPRLIREKGAETEHRLLVHAFALRAAAAALGYALLCAYLWFAEPVGAIWHTALVLGIAILLREPFGVVIAWMQAHTNNRPGTLFSLVALVLKTSLIAWLFYVGSHSITLFAGAVAVEQALISILLVAYYARHVRLHPVPLERALSRTMLSEGALFWISFMAMMATRRVDQLILHPHVSTLEFGAYAAAMQILDNFTMLATILAAGIAPAYVYSQARLPSAHRNIARIALLLGAAGIVGATAIASGAGWIVHILYGSRFAMAVDLLRSMALLSSLIFVDIALTLLPIVLRRPLWVAFKWILTLAVLAAADLIAIPRYGVWGAVVGYGIANACAAGLGFGFWWWQRGRLSEAAL